MYAVNQAINSMKKKPINNMYEIILNSGQKIITWGKIDLVPTLKELRIFEIMDKIKQYRE